MGVQGAEVQQGFVDVEHAYSSHATPSLLCGAKRCRLAALGRGRKPADLLPPLAYPPSVGSWSGRSTSVPIKSFMYLVKVARAMVATISTICSSVYPAFRTSSSAWSEGCPRLSTTSRANRRAAARWSSSDSNRWERSISSSLMPACSATAEWADSQYVQPL